MGITIDFKYEDNKATISLLPLPFEQLCAFFSKYYILNIDNIHVCCWDEKDNEIIINSENYLNILGSLSNINNLNIFLCNYDDYTINKLEFSIENGKIKYDDDSFLVVNIQLNSLDEMIEYTKSFCFKYLNEILKNENFGPLL
jgi:hypothetical protein